MVYEEGSIHRSLLVASKASLEWITGSPWYLHDSCTARGREGNLYDEWQHIETLHRALHYTSDSPGQSRFWYCNVGSTDVWQYVLNPLMFYPLKSWSLLLVNIIAFYSSTIFVESGATDRSAVWASWGFGLVNFLFALPALRLIDNSGRRPLLLSTFPNMAWSLLATGLAYLYRGSADSRLGLLAFFIFVFAAFYSVGEGPVCYPYAAEVFPLSHREIGMSWAVGINAGGAAILALTFPYMLQTFTPTGAFAFYCGLNILAFIMIFLWVPETKELTLEQLDYVFSVPTTRFMQYQLRVVLPFWVKRWVFWQRNTTLVPLALERSEYWAYSELLCGSWRGWMWTLG